MKSGPKVIVNFTRLRVVCEQGTIADRPLGRMRGLLGRRILPRGEGLLLRPTRAIHTAFMRFPVDALFLDKDLEVVKIVPRLAPWRVSSAPRARAVLELAAGECVARGVEIGDQLGVVDSSHSMVRVGPERVGALGAPRVVLVGPDRRFRSVAATLLARRGCMVAIGERGTNLCELAHRSNAEVVLIDAGASLSTAVLEAAKLERQDPAIGVVIVSDEAELGRVGTPVLAKWGSFDVLFGAIEQARLGRDMRRGSLEQR